MAEHICIKSGIHSLTAFIIVFCICCGLCCHGQNVTFEVLNNSFDYAIFVGESNIVLRCCVTDNGRAMIRIEQPNGNANNGQSNCLDYTISVVQEDSGGEYKCTLNYTCMGGNKMSKDLRLYINVPNNDEFPQCIRNGTYGEPYEAGDRLVMSCFCKQGDSCLWTSTIPESHSASRVNTDNVENHTGTEVLQIMVTNETLLVTHQFVCLYYSPGEQPRVCSIGPVGESANDTTVSTIVMKPDKCPETTTTDGVFQGTSQSNTTPEAESERFEGFVLVIIVAGICILLLLATAISLLFVCSRSRRNDSASVPGNVGDTQPDYSRSIHPSGSGGGGAAMKDSSNDGYEATGGTAVSHTYELTEVQSPCEATGGATLSHTYEPTEDLRSEQVIDEHPPPQGVKYYEIGDSVLPKEE